jgi:hypothetical protein
MTEQVSLCEALRQRAAINCYKSSLTPAPIVSGTSCALFAGARLALNDDWQVTCRDESQAIQSCRQQTTAEPTRRDFAELRHVYMFARYLACDPNPFADTDNVSSPERLLLHPLAANKHTVPTAKIPQHRQWAGHADLGVPPRDLGT